ncbi:MAG: exodeoxyribonuclease VII small subunit [Thermomicrobiales bacterium]|nr:exodeoxyribonuclease VII small subunit [Thermomicrobiales bacterium]
MTERDRALAYDDWNRLATEGAFEESLAALRVVVGHLESGNLRLDDSVHCYEVGTLLARRCEQLLDEAELRITRLDEDTDDEPTGQLGFMNE